MSTVPIALLNIANGFLKRRDLEEIYTVERLADISDYGQLAELWDQTLPDCGCEFGKMIQARIEEILVDVLSTISDYDQLMKMLNHASSSSKSRALIEARVVEVLADLLPTISGSGYNRLMEMWRNTSSGSKLREMIEARMEEILVDMILDISNYDQLLKMWAHTSVDSSLRWMIEISVVKVLTNLLPTISGSGYDRLMKMRQYSLIHKSKGMIEARMEEILVHILPRIFYYDRLMEMWGNTSPDSKLREMIEARMEKLLVDILPDVFDYDQLMKMRKNISSDSKCQGMIQARIIELVRSVDTAARPQAWLQTLFAMWHHEVPDFVLPSLQDLAERIKKLATA